MSAAKTDIPDVQELAREMHAAFLSAADEIRRAFLLGERGYLREQWDELCALLGSGAVVPTPVQVRPLADAAAVLREMDARSLVGKVVLDVREQAG